MARAWTATAGVLVIVTAAAGCSDVAGWNIPVTEFHDLARSSICRVRVLCGDFPDQATCETYWSEPPHLYASLPQLVSAGRVAYDGNQARTCLNIFNAATSCSRQLLNTPEAIAACDAVLVGKVPNGGACFLSVECAGGGTCQMADSGCDPYGSCCAGTCTDGGSAATTVVTTFGDSCASSPCAGSLVCGAGSICLHPVPTGGRCDPDLFGRDCDDLGDYCDRGTSTCTPMASIGSSCNPIFTPCVGYAYCDQVQSVCLPLPSLGQPCATGTGACLGSQSCDVGSYTCVATPPGDSCV